MCLDKAAMNQLYKLGWRPARRRRRRSSVAELAPLGGRVDQKSAEHIKKAFVLQAF